MQRKMLGCKSPSSVGPNIAEAETKPRNSPTMSPNRPKAMFAKGWTSWMCMYSATAAQQMTS